MTENDIGGDEKCQTLFEMQSVQKKADTFVETSLVSEETRMQQVFLHHLTNIETVDGFQTNRFIRQRA